ncbi:MAG: YwqG family protein [Ktedonobacteraceae bacterium]
MDKAALAAALNAAGLSRLVKDIDRLVKPSIRLHTTPVDEASLPVGASKLGGLPDLPRGVTWPAWKGLPQSFIAQIHLADVRQYDTEKILPENGVLWFFYDAKQETYGENPADRGGWLVFFKDSDLDKLQRTPAPPALPRESQFHACSTSFTSELTLTQQPQLDIPGLAWTDKDQEQYDPIYSTFYEQSDRATPQHRLLGYPDTIQDDMRLQCQLVSHGVTEQNDPQYNALAQGALNWQLLLQVDSDPQTGMRWASTGMLYYWITLTDLQARAFDHTWMVLQSE